MCSWRCRAKRAQSAIVSPRVEKCNGQGVMRAEGGFGRLVNSNREVQLGFRRSGVARPAKSTGSSAGRKFPVLSGLCGQAGNSQYNLSDKEYDE